MDDQLYGKLLGSNSQDKTMFEEGQHVEKLLAKNDKIALMKAVDVVKNSLTSGRYLYPRVLRQVVSKLSNAGDIEKFEELAPHLPVVFKNQSWYTSAIATTYLNAGKVAKLITDVLPSLAPFPLWSIEKILDKHPEQEKLLLTTVNQIASSTGYHLPQNMMLQHYLKTNRYDEAVKLFESNPQFKDSLLYTNVIDFIRAENNTKVARNLLNIVEKTNLLPRSLGIVYAAYIDALIELNKPEDAENLILNEINCAKPRTNSAGEEIRAVSLRDVNRMALIRLRQKLFETLGREPKFEIPEKTSAAAEATQPAAGDDDANDKRKQAEMN